MKDNVDPLLIIILICLFIALGVSIIRFLGLVGWI